MMGFIGKVLRFVISQGSAKLSMDDLKKRLELSAASIVTRIENGADTETNRGQATHLIGIERWGQRRLRSVLGEPLDLGEYDPVRPGSDQPLKALSSLFTETRQQTLALVDELKKVPGVENMQIAHNELGNLSVRGWLFYLENHANRESQKIK